MPLQCVNRSVSGDYLTSSASIKELLLSNQGPRALRGGEWLGSATDSSAGKDMGCVAQLSGKGRL